MNKDLDNKLEQVSRFTEKRQYSAALDSVNSIIDVNPECYKAHYEKAKVFAHQMIWVEAIECVSVAIQLNENEPMLYFSRARWFVQSQRFHEAHDDLTQLIELENKLNDTYYIESAYFFRALASSYLGNYEDVLNDCDNVRDDYSIYILNKPHCKSNLVSDAKIRKLY